MRRVNFSTTSHALAEAIAFIKEWLVVFAMSVGIIGYFIVNATLHYPKSVTSLPRVSQACCPFCSLSCCSWSSAKSIRVNCCRSHG